MQRIRASAHLRRWQCTRNPTAGAVGATRQGLGLLLDALCEDGTLAVGATRMPGSFALLRTIFVQLQHFSAEVHRQREVPAVPSRRV